jgi:hypothetical protein
MKTPRPLNERLMDMLIGVLIGFFLLWIGTAPACTAEAASRSERIEAFAAASEISNLNSEIPEARLSIKWRPGASASDRAALKSQRGLKRVPGYELIERELGWEIVSLPPGLAKKELTWLLTHPNVEYAEPEGFGEAVPPPPSEISNSQISNSGAASSVDAVSEWYQRFTNAPNAHTVSTGTGVTVAVFDNGLNAHTWTDSHVTESKLFRASETNGTLGGSHGQPVTGLVIAIAPDVKVTNYKIGSSATASCSWTDVSNAFLYAREQGHRIFNLSYGGGSSLLLAQTLTACRASGIAIFVSAGNSGGAAQFPANHAAVYSVSALDPSGLISGFSCRGKVEFAAPGSGLLTSTNNGGWGTFSGTSGSAPIITGIAALVQSQHPTWTGVQVAEHIAATATKRLPATEYGTGGVANAGTATGAITAAVPAKPAPPTITEITETSALISWPVEGLSMVKLDQGDGKYEFQTVGAPTSSYRWSGLSAATNYKVWLRAFNAFGESPRSDAAPFTTVSTTPPPTEEPPPVEEPPPPIEEPPPTGENTELTSSAQWSCSPAANEKYNEGLAKLTDGTNAKALWFAKTARITATFSSAITLTELRITSANDFPVRDPQTITLDTSADGTTWTTAQTFTGIAFSARHQEKILPVSSLPSPVTRYRLTLTSSGQSSPGGVIVQVAELRLRGTTGTTEPPPPIEETWEAVREVVSTSQSAWAPVTAEQTATVTESVRYYERSNLGNVRNDRTEQETTTKTRTVDLPQ